MSIRTHATRRRAAPPRGSLVAYRRKRDLRRSGEPGGTPAKKPAAARFPEGANHLVPRDKSVLTGRSMAKIAAGRKETRRLRSAKQKPEASERRSAEPAPAGPLGFVPPMKALGVTAIPAGDWHSEIKFDGYRALAGLEQGKAVRLWSRNELSLAPDYPEVTAALARLRCRDALLDGEIVALDETGRSHFQLLQQSGQGKRPPVYYYVFDLLRLNGRSFLGETFEVRRAALAKLLAKPPDRVRLSAVFDVPPADLLREAARLGLEGIVAKSAGSRYEPGRRSGAWLKCRISSEQEFVIGGYTPPEGGRSYFGALLIGFYAGGNLQYAGKVGTGFDDATLASLHRAFQTRRRTTCPFANLPATGRPRFGRPMNAAAMRTVQWLRPEFVCQVRFSEWTQDGRLRHPVYVGLRRDKPAGEVVREAAASPGIEGRKPKDHGRENSGR